jgi:hypothetical protein
MGYERHIKIPYPDIFLDHIFDSCDSTQHETQRRKITKKINKIKQ